MTAILPQGLLQPPPDNQLVLDNTASHADNQDILRRFWRGGYHCPGPTSSALTQSIVYAIQSAASHDDSSSRASNLFWRVWSSPSLSRSITSTTLTRLLHHCGQAFELTAIADSIPLPRLGSYEVPLPLSYSIVSKLICPGLSTQPTDTPTQIFSTLDPGQGFREESSATTI